MAACYATGLNNHLCIVFCCALTLLNVHSEWQEEKRGCGNRDRSPLELQAQRGSVLPPPAATALVRLHVAHSASVATRPAQN